MATHYDTSAGGNVLDDRNYPAETDSELVGQTGNDTLIATTGVDVLWGEWIGFDSRYYYTDGDDTAQILWGDTTMSVTMTTTSGTSPSSFGYVREGDGSLRQVTMNRIDHVDIVTGSGDDLLAGTPNKWDKIDGGDGVDRWTDSFSLSSTPISVDMAQVSSSSGQTFADGSVIKNIEAAGISSSSSNSKLTLSSHDDTFRDHGDYDDRVEGGTGNDLYILSGGKDFITDGSGVDDTLRLLWSGETKGIKVSVNGTLSSAYGTAVVGYGKGVTSTHQVDFNGIDHLDVRAGSGDDILQGMSYKWDKFNGGGGVDLWRDNLDNLPKVDIDMAMVSSRTGQTFSDGTVVKRIERVDLTLTDGRDTFKDKGNHNDKIAGAGGNDSFTTSGGRDVFNGGGGTDTVILNWRGINKKMFVDNDGGSRAYVNTGSNWSESTKRIDFDRVEKVIAKLGDRGDLAETGDGNDQLFGYGGNDTLRGGGGNDLLSGGNNDDVLAGGKGKDTLDGGKGINTLEGGGGADEFILSKGPGYGKILDYKDGTDKIGLDDGLTFSKLKIVDKKGYALIEVKATGEDLARVYDVEASDLDAGDFFVL